MLLGQVGIAPLVAVVVGLLGLGLYATMIRRVVHRPRLSGDDRHVAQLAVTFAVVTGFGDWRQPIEYRLGLRGLDPDLRCRRLGSRPATTRGRT